MNAASFDRVREHTPSFVNERIELLTSARIDEIARQGRGAVEHRLFELDREWDVDRALMLAFPLIGGATFAAGIFHKRGWLGLFTAQLAFLGLHAINGWCPPVSVFRRLGFRTRSEIEAEKNTLLSLLPEAGEERGRGRLRSHAH